MLDNSFDIAIFLQIMSLRDIYKGGKSSKISLAHHRKQVILDSLKAWPLNIKSTKSSGRGLFASKFIKTGDSVLIEQPVSYVLKNAFLNSKCSFCFGEISSESDGCPCRLHFCSNSCLLKFSASFISESAEGSFHKYHLICRIFREISKISRKFSVDEELLRLIIFSCLSRFSSSFFDIGGKKVSRTDSSCLGSLKSNSSIDNNNKSWKAVVSESISELLNVLDELKISTDTWSHRNHDEIFRLACRINGNSYAIMEKCSNNVLDNELLPNESVSQVTIGVGMLPLNALINHSCKPNCAFITMSAHQDSVNSEDAKIPAIEVRALCDIQAGEEITFSYIDSMQSRVNRRLELIQTKNFWCECARCMENYVFKERNTGLVLEKSIDCVLDAFMCKFKECDGIYCTEHSSLNIKTDICTDIPRYLYCSSCGNQCTGEEIKQARDEMRREFEAADCWIERDDPHYYFAHESLDKFVRRWIFGQQLNFLKPHPRHELIYNALFRLLNCSKYLDLAVSKYEELGEKFGVVSEDSSEKKKSVAMIKSQLESSVFKRERILKYLIVCLETAQEEGWYPKHSEELLYLYSDALVTSKDKGAAMIDENDVEMFKNHLKVLM